MNKIIIPVLAILALAAGYFVSNYLVPKELNLLSATWIKTPIELPEFKLIDHNNKTFDNKRFEGKWSLLFFGYTNCPDICPDSLNMLKTMVENLEDEDKKDIQIIFVSVDPDRDPPEKLKQYVQYFNKDFIGVTAEIPKLTPLTKKLGIIHYIKKHKDRYDVAHSGSMTLINPQGKYTAVFSAPHDPVRMAIDLTNIRRH